MKRLREPPARPTSAPIRTLASLREHLQWAMELEHFTIPPYLCALYSIRDDQGGTNLAAAELIRSVVMEEMLHLTLAANVLNAVGGTACIDHPAFVPDYGRSGVPLPKSGLHFKVAPQRFGKPALRTFMKIEHPAPPTAPPQSDHYRSIGQFYRAIEAGLARLVREHGEKRVFTGRPDRQVPRGLYYGGGGELVAVRDLESALFALDVICAQGEGARRRLGHDQRARLSIFDGDHRYFGEPRELAHYYRFGEILAGRRYVRGDTEKSGPTGPRLPVDWSAVWPMQTAPRRGQYPARSAIRRAMDEFARSYTRLLANLERALRGAPERLPDAVAQMYALKYQALELMKIDSGDGKTTVGPNFEYLAE